ncbi:MAG: hypothetical protein Q8L23_06700 [Caulobacter sp.]|nr:hypothetical protein [Caulobacter sp.]
MTGKRGVFWDWVWAGLKRIMVLALLTLLSACVCAGVVLTSDERPANWLTPEGWRAWFAADQIGAGASLVTAVAAGLGLAFSIFQVFFSREGRQTREALLAAKAEIIAEVREQGKSTRDHFDTRFTQLEILIASGPTRDAEQRADGEQIETQRREIETLRISLAEAERTGNATQTELTKLANELSTARARFIADLSSRDRAYRGEIAVIRDAVKDIASTPEGRAALRQFNGGEEVEALHVLDRLRSARDQARQHRADLASAAEARRIAVLALDAMRRGKISVDAVRIRFQALVALDPGNQWDWIELSRLHRIFGQLSDAREAADKADSLAASERQRSVSFDTLAGIARSQGDLPTARDAYQHAFTINKKRTGGDPKHGPWRRSLLLAMHWLEAALLGRHSIHLNRQRDLAISHERLGDVASEEGDLHAARKAYEDSFEIRRALANRDPKNTDWQRGLSISFAKLGDLAKAEGDLPTARKAFEDSFKINKTLGDLDPKNTDWQRDLSISFNRLGDVARQEGDLLAARTAFEDGLFIAKTLGDLDPKNTDWQGDLSASYERLGDVARAEGDLPTARKAYEDSFEIRRALANRDPKNTDWQNWLSISFVRLGVVAAAEGDLSAARKAFEDSFDISETLTKWDPHNLKWRLVVVETLCRLAAVCEAAGDRTSACDGFRSATSQLDAICLIAPTHAHAWLLSDFAAAGAVRVCG